MTPEERSELARMGAAARWGNGQPVRSWMRLERLQRGTAPVPTTKRDDAKINGPPLHGGRADGNR